MIDVDRLPAEIRTSTRAVLWRFEQRNGTRTKVPYQPTQPWVPASVTNPQTWASFDLALAAYNDGTPGAVSALPAPEQTKAAPVPSDHGLRPNDVHARAPAAPHLREPGPEHAVDRREKQASAARAVENRDLVSERDNFQVQRRARPDEEAKRVEQRNEDGHHT